MGKKGLDFSAFYFPFFPGTSRMNTNGVYWSMYRYIDPNISSKLTVHYENNLVARLIDRCKAKFMFSGESKVDEVKCCVSSNQN